MKNQRIKEKTDYFHKDFFFTDGNDYDFHFCNGGRREKYVRTKEEYQEYLDAGGSGTHWYKIKACSPLIEQRFKEMDIVRKTIVENTTHWSISRERLDELYLEHYEPINKTNPLDIL